MATAVTTMNFRLDGLSETATTNELLSLLDAVTDGWTTVDASYAIFAANLDWTIEAGSDNSGWKNVFQFQIDADDVDDIGEASGAKFTTNTISFLGQSNDGTNFTTLDKQPNGGEGGTTQGKVDIKSIKDKANLLQMIETADGVYNNATVYDSTTNPQGTNANTQSGNQNGSIGDDFMRRIANIMITGRPLHSPGAIDMMDQDSRLKFRETVDVSVNKTVTEAQALTLGESNTRGQSSTRANREHEECLPYVMLTQLLDTSGGRKRVAELMTSRAGGDADTRKAVKMCLLQEDDTIQFDIRLDATSTSSSGDASDLSARPRGTAVDTGGHEESSTDIFNPVSNQSTGNGTHRGACYRVTVTMKNA